MLPTPNKLAEDIKREILADVGSGIVPLSVASFSELHDYLDANCYGGTEALLNELDEECADTDEGHRSALERICDLCNPAFDIVDAWIKAGGIRKQLTGSSLQANPSGMKVTVYRPRLADGVGAPQAFVGDNRPTSGDWVQSAKAELPETEHPPRLLLLGRAFLIYSMYHAREPYFLGVAVENFGAACKKLGYTLPLGTEDGNWLTYGRDGIDPGPPEHIQFMLNHIAAVFGASAAKGQAEALGVEWHSSQEDDVS